MGNECDIKQKRISKSKIYLWIIYKQILNQNRNKMDFKNNDQVQIKQVHVLTINDDINPNNNNNTSNKK